MGVAVDAADVLGSVSLPRAAEVAGIRDGCAEAAAVGVAVCSFVWVVAALGLGASRFTDVERGGERLLRVPPGRVSVEGVAEGGRCEAVGTVGRKPAGFCKGVLAAAAGLSRLFGGSFEAVLSVTTGGAAVVDGGASADSENQSESTSSVLGVEATGEFCFDDSPDNVGCSVGAAGLVC